MEFANEAILNNVGKILGEMLGLQPVLVNPVKIIILYLFLKEIIQSKESEEFIFRTVALSEMEISVAAVLKSKKRKLKVAINKLKSLGLIQRTGNAVVYELTPKGKITVKMIHMSL